MYYAEAAKALNKNLEVRELNSFYPVVMSELKMIFIHPYPAEEGKPGISGFICTVSNEVIGIWDVEVMIPEKGKKTYNSWRAE